MVASSVSPKLLLGAVTSNISACRYKCRNQFICHGTVYSGIARMRPHRLPKYVYRQPYVDCMPCALAARMSPHIPRLDFSGRGKILINVVMILSPLIWPQSSLCVLVSNQNLFIFHVGRSWVLCFSCGGCSCGCGIVRTEREPYRRIFGIRE